jgi:hypothetical protein
MALQLRRWVWRQHCDGLPDSRTRKAYTFFEHKLLPCLNRQKIILLRPLLLCSRLIAGCGTGEQNRKHQRRRNGAEADSLRRVDAISARLHGE